MQSWFLKRTYHHSSYSDLNYLLSRKIDLGSKISVCLPTLNVEKTIGPILEILIDKFQHDYPLVDQIAIIDSRSTDRTVEIAKSLGCEVYFDDEILPAQGVMKGKGEALWKSLAVLTGDIIVWTDSDIVNFHPRFIWGLIGPLIIEKKIQFVKGFYERSQFIDGVEIKNEGGRVTELMARPYLNAFFPELAYLVQPLSGEMAVRRDAIWGIPFYNGYAVDIAMLIHLYKKFGIDAIAQSNLEERVHNNQKLSDLSKMAFTILKALITISEELGLININSHPGSKYLQYTGNVGQGEFNKVFRELEIEVTKRPPMVGIVDHQEDRSV